MIPPSANWLRTSCTTTPAVRPTARMASAEKRNDTDPPMSRPMNTFGLATLICVRMLLNSVFPVMPLSGFELATDGLDVRREQRDRTR